MGRVFEGVDAGLARFIAAQHVFFVATAPGRGGHVNVSPKGHDSFRVIDPLTVAYLDLTGSGVETIAHTRENGRVTVMFCAFEGPPRIVRLYGTGRVLEPGDPGFEAMRALFPAQDGVRSVISITLDRISDSCGYGVPRMKYAGERTQMQAWLDSKGAEGLERYRAEHDTSIDGLPARG